MKAEYDFSKGEQGKFYYPDAVFSFPVYLEPDVSDFMSQLADEKDVDIQELVTAKDFDNQVGRTEGHNQVTHLWKANDGPGHLVCHARLDR